MINHPNRRRTREKVLDSTPKTKAKARPKTRPNHDHDYSALLLGVHASFAMIPVHERLFSTDTIGLYDIYLDSLPAERQVHNCHCCRRFIETYGGLVAVESNGMVIPVMWNQMVVPEFYQAAFSELARTVSARPITGPFLTKQRVWGTPHTGDWAHISVVPQPDRVFVERALTAEQTMAAAKENHRTVLTALAEFKPSTLNEALRILNAEAVSRSDKFIGPVQWLLNLHARPKGRRGDNLLWRAIASAPEGYCHPRASVVGSLLDDIAAGKPFGAIQASFNAKVAPLAYQRPQAPPSAGNIKAAEALVEKLGIAPSLERRMARFEEVQGRIWTPWLDTAPVGTAGVFGHIKPKGHAVPPSADLGRITMTWEKFSRTVMEPALAIEIRVPQVGCFIALTTAVNLDAPPILKWDRDDERNPVAWYVYPNHSPAPQWGLTGGAWVPLTAISTFPNMWGSRPMPFLSNGVVLIIDGARDTRTGSGNALFPECLKDELHPARATIEAYSRSAELTGRAEASACGYDVRKNAAIGIELRALAGNAWTRYMIDRWD